LLTDKGYVRTEKKWDDWYYKTKENAHNIDTHLQLEPLRKLLIHPPIIEVETINICNAKCSFCLYKDKIVKKKAMEDDLFDVVCTQIAQYGTEQLCLTPMLGDPLLDPRLAYHTQKIKQQDNMGILRVVTNGLAFDKHSDEELIQIFNNVDVLEISLGPNQEVYRQMFGVDRFEHLLKQLQRIVLLMPQVTHKIKKLILCGRACGKEFSVDERLSKLALQLCGSDKISWTQEYMDWGGKIETLPLSTPILRVDNAKTATEPCYYGLTPHIYHDGKVGLCACAGADESLLIGDLYKQSWRDILLSPKRIDLIFSFLDGCMPTYCKKCSFYNSVSKHKSLSNIAWKTIKFQFPNLQQDLTNVTPKLQLKKLSTITLQQRETLFTQYLHRANGVLHLGAHLGQEAKKYAEQNKPVIWVEALLEIHERLSKNIAEYPSQKSFCALLSDKNGIKQTFYISNNSEGVSSSLFEFGEYGTGDQSLWPKLNLHMSQKIELSSVCLDSLFKENKLDSNKYNFWILDLQGAELLALKGAEQSLGDCMAIYVEVSTVPVYKNGVLWSDLQQWLTDKGFMALWQPENAHDDVLFCNKKELETVRRQFQSEHYLNHNHKRLEHLASLKLPFENKKVLEVGAGVGDHSGFYLEKNCQMTITESRPETLLFLEQRFLDNKLVTIQQLDMDKPHLLNETYDVIHCYGLLYHLKNPQPALSFMAKHCTGLLLLETCVSHGEEQTINLIDEPAWDYTQAFYGVGCRPTRTWIWEKLNEHISICICS
ncbi:MAG: FkbM family methyltransferase, partial [Thiotrichaceae bacterium]|nr:FkbM family methyltransferase [Thiotrichaceae bacterium]